MSKLISLLKKDKNPKGGLSAFGRRRINKLSGSNLRAPVKKAKTPTQLRRKGSFLARHYGGPSKPLKDKRGRPTRHALQANAWGEPVPKTQASAKRLGQLGRRLLERYKKKKK